MIEKREKKNLMEYVTKAEPEVNKLLRKGKADVDGLFDGLFTIGSVPNNKLYRYLPKCFVDKVEDCYCDKGYLSCSIDPSCFIFRVGNCSHLACLVISLPSETKRINVNEIFPECNDEGEFILPRGLRLHLIHTKRYEKEEFDELLDSINIMVRSDCLIKCGIKSITKYELSL